MITNDDVKHTKHSWVRTEDVGRKYKEFQKTDNELIVTDELIKSICDVLGKGKQLLDDWVQL